MRILFLDDDQTRFELFFAMAKQKYPEASITWVQNPAGAISQLNEERWDQVYLDHDLADFHYVDYREGLEGTGLDVVKHIIKVQHVPGNDAFAGVKFVVHSWNPEGGDRMAKDLKECGLNVERRHFGPNVVV